MIAIRSFVRLADGSIRNAFTVHVLNKALETRLFELTVEGIPGIDVTLVGDTVASGNPLIVVGPDQTRELRALLTTHAPLPADLGPADLHHHRLQKTARRPAPSTISGGRDEQPSNQSGGGQGGDREN